MVIVDLIEVREKQRLLLTAATKVFGDDAHSVWTPRDSTEPAEIRDSEGNIIAYGWFDEDGRPEFKPWCSWCAN